MKILLVEDNEGEQLIIKEAFEEAQVNCELAVVSDGEEALKYLKNHGPFKEAARPDLVILDLNLPKVKGQEVLKEIRAERRLSHIPVIILSNSRALKDVCECYELHASAYVGKPPGFEGFIHLAKMIRMFWSDLVCYCSPA